MNRTSAIAAMAHGPLVSGARETQEDFGLVEPGGCAPPVWVGPHRLAHAARSVSSEDAMRGSRANKGKPRVGLIVPSFLIEMGAVLTMGAEKYAPDNWKKGLPVREIMDSALRHIYAFMDGENVDQESGKHHLAHAAVNLMFAFWMVAKMPKHDDRVTA